MAVVKVFKELSDAGTVLNIVGGSSIRSSLPEVQNWENYQVIVNGRFESGDYTVQDNDLILVRAVPFGLTTGLIIAGVIGGIALVGGLTWLGIETYKARKEAERLADEVDKLKNNTRDEVVNLPYLRGSSNTVATGKTQPYIIGRHLFTPYILNGVKNYKGFSTIEGTNGEKQFYNVVFECGFNKQVLKKIYCDDVVIKDFDDETPQDGKYYFNSGSVFASDSSFIEIKQNGQPFTTSILNKKIVEKTPNEILKIIGTEETQTRNELYYTLEKNAQGFNACIMFNGLRAYLEDGTPGSKTRHIYGQFSFDYAEKAADGQGAAATWHDFGFTKNGTTTNEFTGNTLTQVRYCAAVDFEYNNIFNADGTRKHDDPVTVRFYTEDRKPAEGSEYSDCYIQFLQSVCFDTKKTKAAGALVSEKIIETREAAQSTLLAMRIEATQANEDKLKSIQIITNGIARTWNGTAWSTTKTPTSNPAAWLLEVLTSDAHNPSKVADSAIDLDSLGEWYEYCEEEERTINYVISAGMTKSAIFDMILESGRATMYRSIYGKIAVAIDAEKENSICVLNEQNLITFSYDKNIGRKVDGVKLSYIDETDYQENTIIVMYDGSDPDERGADCLLTSVRLNGITNYEEAYKHIIYLMKKDRLRPITCRAEVGEEGFFYTPYSKILVQHPALKIGKGNGEIKAVIYNDAETKITGFELYDAVNLDAINNYTMVINCATNSDTFAPVSVSIVGNKGITKEVELVTPFTVSGASFIPKPGAVFSYGMDVSNVAEEMVLTGIERNDNGYTLTLQNYDERIFTVDHDIPEYTPAFTTPAKVINNIPSSITPSQVQENIEKTTAELNAQIREIEEAGVTAITYEMELNTVLIKKNGSTLNPSFIQAEAVEKQGTSRRENFNGIFKVFINDGAVAAYASNAPESSITYNLPSNVETVRVELWNATNTNRIDRQTLPVTQDGADGCLVLLDNTFVSFKGTADGVVERSETYATVKGYRGSNTMDCVIDENKMRELNGVIPGLNYDLVGVDCLKVEATAGGNLADAGRLLVPVLIDSEVNLYEYEYKDEGGNVYGTYEINDNAKYIILYFDYQKIKVKDATRENVVENTPRYLGKFEALEDVPAHGVGDWFLYSGVTDAPSGLYKGHFYTADSSGAWVDKAESEVKEMDDVFNDMLSIVDSSAADSSAVSIVNRLVSSEAFIDKLATRVISLQSGGEIKSSNYATGEAGFKIDYNGDVEFNKGRFRSSLGNTFVYSEPFEPSGSSSIIVVHTVYAHGFTVSRVMQAAFLVTTGSKNGSSAGVTLFTIDLVELFKNSTSGFKYRKVTETGLLTETEKIELYFSPSLPYTITVTELILA